MHQFEAQDCDLRDSLCGERVMGPDAVSTAERVTVVDRRCVVQVFIARHLKLPAHFHSSKTLPLWFENKQVFGTVSTTRCQR